MIGGRVSFSVRGGPTFSVNLFDSQLEQLGIEAGETVEAQRVGVSRQGVELWLPARVVTYEPGAASDDSQRWSEFFDNIATELHGGRLPAFRLALYGDLAIPVMRRWAAQYRRGLAEIRRARGRPARTQRWDAAREEIFARILERRAYHHDSLRDAISVAAQLNPSAFRRAFGGKATAKRIEAAAAYFKRHARDARE